MRIYFSRAKIGICKRITPQNMGEAQEPDTSGRHVLDRHGEFAAEREESDNREQHHVLHRSAVLAALTSHGSENRKRGIRRPDLSPEATARKTLQLALEFANETKEG